jgi:hypothetical protein
VEGELSYRSDEALVVEKIDVLPVAQIFCRLEQGSANGEATGMSQRE